MKAMAQASWRAGEPLAMTELPDPALGARDVRVEVEAAGVNPVDWKMRTSGFLRMAARILAPSPAVIGVDFAGTVREVGSACTAFSPGDRVVGGTDFSRGQYGSYADTVVVREDQICALPDGIAPTDAAALPIPGVTAWRSLFEVGRLREVEPGDRRVLVLGASGGVGQLAVQLAKMADAVVVGVCSGRNEEFVESLGADVVVDYTAGDALALAEKHGPYQVVVDCADGYSPARCRALLRPGGRHVMVSGERFKSVVQAIVPPFTSKSILGRPTGAWLKPVVDAVATGKLSVNIADVLPLSEAEEAHRRSRTARLTGKLILRP